MTKIRYPSGRVVTYTDTGVTTTAGSTETLATGISQLPFGPVNGMTIGSGAGVTVSRPHDQRYQMTGLTAGSLVNRSYNRDLAGNIININDLLDATRNEAFTYDDLDRLTQGIGPYGTIDYTYDLNGNRLTRALTVDPDPTVTETFDYWAGSNRLRQITNGAVTGYTHDAVGNITAYGDNTLVYNDANRLAEISDSGGTLGQYIYDYQQRRVVKTSGAVTTIYHYDQWGQVIAESDASGTMLREYAYTRPEHGRARLAIIDSATATIYPIVPDHLGTPVMITDQAGAPVWSADQLPFGQTTPHTSNTISQHLRFPGQYSDTESGLHYNYYRYYNPNLGRYHNPDSVGLDGGINLFSYGNNNPINLMDFYGLEAAGPDSKTDEFWNPGAPGEGFAGGIADFLENCQDMRDANTIGADKYFHCMANCKAARRGPGGQDAAEGISEGREWCDENIKGDSRSSCNADRAANSQGRYGNKNLSCEDICRSLRPPGLPKRY